MVVVAFAVAVVTYAVFYTREGLSKSVELYS